MKKSTKLIAVATLAFGLAACATVPEPSDPVPSADTVTVVGSASYRERIALLPGAEMEVRIEDTGRAGAPARILGKQRYSLTGLQVPFGFAVQVPRAELNAAVQNTVRVRIEGKDGRLMWTTDTVHPVPPVRDDASVDVGQLLLVRAAR